MARVNLEELPTVTHSYTNLANWHKLDGNTSNMLPLMASLVRLVRLPISSGNTDNCVFWTNSPVSDCRLNSCTGNDPNGLLFSHNTCSCLSWKMHSGTSLNWLSSIDNTVSLGNFPKLNGNDCSLLLDK